MKTTRRFVSAGLAGLFMTGTGAAARASDLAKPAGKTILTISGLIGRTNVGKTAQFDRDSLEALGLSQFTTKTPWYNHPVTFEGVLMTRLIEAVQATGETVVATALNDYETVIPVSDFAAFGVLLAMKRDGEIMPVSDKGPLFIVYPYDSKPDLQTKKYYSRSAWQLSQLQFK
jgi:hypothetical protein